MTRLTISKLAALLKLNVETIRYYERIDLMTRPNRTAGGHRDYSDEDVQRLRFICRARALGFSIDDVRMLLKLSEPDHFSCGEVRKIARQHLLSVRAQLAKLQKTEALLADATEECDPQDRDACSVLALLVTASGAAANEIDTLRRSRVAVSFGTDGCC